MRESGGPEMAALSDMGECARGPRPLVFAGSHAETATRRSLLINRQSGVGEETGVIDPLRAGRRGVTDDKCLTPRGGRKQKGLCVLATKFA
jgi:hypothetical protein